MTEQSCLQDRRQSEEERAHPKPCFHPYPNSFVGFVITNSFHTNRVRRKRQAIVFHLLRAHFGEDLPVADIGYSSPEQIEISGWTIRLRGPELQEQCTLEDK